MSPLPTQLNRQDVDWCRSHVGTGSANAGRNVRYPAGSHGECVARPRHLRRLAERKGKDCDRQPRLII